MEAMEPASSSSEEELIFEEQFDSDDTTINDYFHLLHSAEKNTNLTFHIHSLAKVIASIPSGYLVKQIGRDRIIYMEMKARALRRILDKESIEIKQGSRMRRMCLSKLLDEPEFCNSISYYEGIEFLSDDPDAFNVWTGYEFDFTTIGEVNMDLLKPFLDYVKDIICDGNEANYQKEMMKNAWQFQNPSSHLGWATALIERSETDQPSKTDLYTNLLCSLWGEQWSLIVQINQPDDLSDDLLRNKKLVVANIPLPVQRIKDDLYKPRRTFERIRNVNNFIIHLHSDEGINKDLYFVLKIADKNPEQLVFTDEMKTHLLKYLLQMDVSSFDPTKLVPTITEKPISPGEAQVEDPKSPIECSPSPEPA
jgi:hypothetical protein